MPDGGMVLPPPPLPLTRLPLISSVKKKNFRPWPPHHGVASSAPRPFRLSLPEQPQGVLGIHSTSLTSA